MSFRRKHEYRKEFNQRLMQSEYLPGIKYFDNEYTRCVKENSLQKDVLSTLWGFQQRFRFVIGDIAGIKKEISKVSLGVFPDGIEVDIARTFVEYAESRYQKAYFYILRGLKACAAEHEVGSHAYELMRLHLLGAKCNWRIDDFTRATAHLAQSMYYLKLYEDEQPADDKYSDYYYARILTVYPRLLNQRRGPDSTGAQYNTTVRNYLKEALEFLHDPKSKCGSYPPIRKNSKVGHIFEAEIFELQAVAIRNRRLRDKKFKSGDQIENGRGYKKRIKKAREIIQEEFSSQKCRRGSHVDRIEGFTIAKTLLKQLRESNLPANTIAQIKKARLFFLTEETNRLGLYKHKGHATLARVYNNLALTHLIEGQYLMQNNSIGARSCIDDAIMYLKESGRVNVDKSGSKIKGVEIFSFPQFLTNLNYQVEAELRLAELDGEMTVDRFNTITALHRMVVDGETAHVNTLTSISAVMDIGRRTHPIFEAVLEACYRRNKESDCSKIESDKIMCLVFEVFQRGVAPFSTRLNELPVSLRDSINVRDIGENVLRKLVKEKGCKEYYEDIALLRSHILGKQNSLNAWRDKLIVDPVELTDLFTESHGSMLVQFLGFSNIYFLYFSGLENEPDQVPRLIRIPDRNRGFTGVRSIQKMSEVVQGGIKEILHHNDTASDFELANEDRKQLLHDIELNLKLLYEAIVPELELEGSRADRVYIISDGWGWNIPWTALIKEGKDKICRFWIEDTIICQQASLNGWSKQKEDQGEYEENKKLEIVGACSATDHNNDTKFKEQLDVLKRILLGEEGEDEYFEINTLPFKFFSGDCKKELLHAFATAQVIVLLGHGEDNKENPSEFVFVLEGLQGKPPVIIRPQDIIGLNLSNVRLAILLICDGGQGRTIAGALPNSLASAFYTAGVTSVVYSHNILEDKTALDFTKYFFQKLANQDWFGAAYQASLKTIIDAYPEDRIAIMAEWSNLRLLGGQICRFS